MTTFTDASLVATDLRSRSNAHLEIGDAILRLEEMGAPAADVRLIKDALVLCRDSIATHQRTLEYLLDQVDVER